MRSLQQKYQGTKSHGRRRTSRKTDVDSDESESDQDQLTSSRTESSNQLDMKQKHSKCEFISILVYYFIQKKLLYIHIQHLHFELSPHILSEMNHKCI